MQFSESTQAFYASDIDYPNLPEDVIEISSEDYQKLFSAINSGSHVYLEDGESVISEVRPDSYHEWDADLKSWTISDSAQQQMKADQVTLANQKKSQLLDNATLAIPPLQDAVDLDMATETEASQLTALKKYRVLLNRVDTSLAPEINWPDAP
ncbi:tail fiber assembly protein [Pantoea septica]|uniref:tail fiber assembly protein n=1 Tax=Pantoea septica TaxID=472695 RepID=UPI00289F0136|nr:tail fiber assembly protein [Pantoea septica]